MNPQSARRRIPSVDVSSPRARGGIATVALLLLIPLLVLIGGDGFRGFLDFGAGVLSLVSLSCSVIWGLVATDRLFLNTRQRLVAQAIHRTTAVSSIAFLLLHVTVKIALDHTSLLAAVVPFGLGVSGTAGLIGFGSVAGLLMIFTGLTGALRSAFASPVQVAARWRAVHMLAYPAWCSALIHGLYAGRAAKPWVTVMYCLCLAAVAGAVALRAAPEPVKRRIADRVLALLQSSRGRRRRRRDTADASLPGSRSSAFADTLSGARSAALADPPAEAAAPRMPAPNPPLYEAPPSAASYDTLSGAAYDTLSGAAYDTLSGAASPRGGVGMAAAYRAVSGSASGPDYGSEPPLQPTETLPRVEEDAASRWPSPSPPPPAEAPPSAYDPAYDTPYGGTPAYGGTPGYDGGTAYADTSMYSDPSAYTAAPAYDTTTPYAEGPVTEPLPGPFQAPSSGEPWNAPTGGMK
ncbi:ferric reductase-like transmembrane domain-containing protein [Streptomyces sp. NPDC002004]